MAFRVLIDLLASAYLLVMIFIFSLMTPTLLVSSVSASTPSQNITIAKPNCVDRCGDVSIPFPFGTTAECYQHHSFWVTCNDTFDPPKLFAQDSPIEITDISIDGQIKILQFIAQDCYSRNGRRTSSRTVIQLPTQLTVNNTANKFTIVGCDAYGYVSGQRLDRDYTTGCSARCESEDDLVEGSCMGVGCCQVSLPEDVWSVMVSLSSYLNHSEVMDFNNCSYAFVVEESAFNFSSKNLTNLKNVAELPMVVDWAIGNGTCEEAKMNSTAYACVYPNSTCYKPENGYGYRCRCPVGYQGNPYLSDGCQDIDECNDPGLHKCKYHCLNTEGGFTCPCPKGYHGDGRMGGDGCSRNESVLALKLVAGIALGILVLLLVAILLHLVLKRRSSRRMKQFFPQNGGITTT